MATATTMQGKSVGLTVVSILARLMLLWLLPGSNEGWQPVDVGSGRAALLPAPLVWLIVLVLGIGLRIARQEGLRLPRPERLIGRSGG
jgi:hypothetical protein